LRAESYLYPIKDKIRDSKLSSGGSSVSLTIGILYCLMYPILWPEYGHLNEEDVRQQFGTDKGGYFESGHAE
jgi:hypothetical protein